MIDNINKIIEEFEKLGCSHEEAVNIVEHATTLSNEEMKEIERISDEFSRIGCTSFQLTADEIKKITKRAEWWSAEDGGVFCSNCGLFFDDYYELAPNQCEKCGSIMNENLNPTVWRDYHLSLDGVKYAYETEYPEWLLKLRNEYKNKNI